MNIDQRENGLLHFFKEKDQNVTTQNLSIGDVQFTDGKDHVYIIIERKNIKDLAASIKDGRYSEQKQRLLSFRNNHPHTIIAYIIEGHFSFHPQFSCGNMSGKALSSAIINTMIRDNIMVWLLKNEEETKYLLDAMHIRFSEDPKKYFEKNENNTNVYTHALAHIQYKKKENINPRMCLIMQLSCIPGVSSGKAQEIVDTLNVNTMSELLHRMRENNDVFKDVKGIGKKLKDSIRAYL